MQSIQTDSNIHSVQHALPDGYGQLRHTLAEIFDLVRAGRCGRIASVSGITLEADAIVNARDLLQAQGVGYGQRVIVRTTHSVATVAWLVAVWHLGACAIPVNAQITDDALNAIAEDSNAIACCAPDANLIQGLGPGIATSFSFRTPPRVTGVDLALLIYTSGSTGKPKGILLTHSNVMSALKAITEYQSLTPADSILCVPPLHFDYGLYQVLFGLHVGCTVWLAEPPFNPVKILNWIKHLHPTVLPVVPALGIGLAQTLSAFKQSCPGIRLITNTGGHLPEQTVKTLQQVFPSAEIMPMYGLTESKRALFMPNGLAHGKPGSVGKPMPGLEAKVFVEQAAEDGAVHFREADAHEVGKLFVRGASVMQGYNSAESGAGATLFAGAYRDDNWLCTGDLFSTDEDGFFYFRGRDKELIKQGGYCLYPRDIEAIIETFEPVLGAVLVGIVDRNGDEVACLFVRLAQHPDPTQQAEFKQWIKSRLDPDYLPRRIEFVEDWPLNSNGKIDRHQLRQSICTP